MSADTRPAQQLPTRRGALLPAGLTLGVLGAAFLPQIPAAGLATIASGATLTPFWVTLAIATALAVMVGPPRIPRASLLSRAWTSWCVFGVWCVGVAALSNAVTSTALGAQLLILPAVTYWIAGCVVERLPEPGTLARRRYDLMCVALVVVYLLAIFASLRLGPVYSGQVGAVSRFEAGTFTLRGIGFAQGVNSAAATVIVLAPLLYHLTARRSRRVLGMALAGAALLATDSRSAIIAVVVSAGALAAWHVLTRGSRGTGRSITVLGRAVVPVTVVCLIAGFGVAAVGSTAADADRQSDVAFLFEELSTNRAMIWREGAEAWTDSGALRSATGAGLRSSHRLENDRWQTQHNLYLSLLSDVGLIGLALFLWWVGRFWWALRPAAARSSISSALPLLAFGALLVHNFSEVFFYDPGLLVMVVFVATIVHRTAASGDPYPARSAPPAEPRAV